MRDTSFSQTNSRTMAETIEEIRFNRVLAALDEQTAWLLRSERLSWQIAELARQQEVAGRQYLQQSLYALRPTREQFPDAIGDDGRL